MRVLQCLSCSDYVVVVQLILPEPLKLLPLCTLGMIKNPLFSEGLASDERSFLFAYVSSMPAYGQLIRLTLLIIVPGCSVCCVRVSAFVLGHRHPGRSKLCTHTLAIYTVLLSDMRH